MHIHKLLWTKWLRIALVAAGAAAMAVLVEMFRYRCAQSDARALLMLPFAALFILGVLLATKGRFTAVSPVGFLAILVMTGLALLLRYALFDVRAFDFEQSLSVWLGAFAEAPGLSGFGVNIGDYNVPYRYVLLAIAKLLPESLWLYGVKLFSLVFELVLAYYTAAVVSLKSGRFAVRCAAFFAVLLVPTVWGNGAIFSQCDAVYTALGMGALYYGLTGKSRRSYLLLALAFSFKLQTVFLMPAMLLLLFAKRIRLRDCWVFPATFVALLIPAIAAGRNAREALAVYFHQAQSYPELTLAAPSAYSLFTPERVDARIFSFAGILFAGCACLALLLYLWRIRGRLTTTAILDGAFLYALMMPLFLPHMHERYFFCADALSVVHLFYHKKRWYVPFSVILISFLCCYTEAPYNANPVSLGVMGVALLTVMAYALYRFYMDTAAPEAEEEARA